MNKINNSMLNYISNESGINIIFSSFDVVWVLANEELNEWCNT
jgi:hypothetical protein